MSRYGSLAVTSQDGLSLTSVKDLKCDHKDSCEEGLFMLRILSMSYRVRYILSAWFSLSSFSCQLQAIFSKEAATHLSTNPIQCLRSKYILEAPPVQEACGFA